MGLSDKVNSILRNVKKIGKIPDEVIKDVKKELEKFDDKLGELNVKDQLQDLIELITRMIEQQFTKMRKEMSRGMRGMNSTMKRIPAAVERGARSGIKSVQDTVTDANRVLSENFNAAIAAIDKEFKAGVADINRAVTTSQQFIADQVNEAMEYADKLKSFITGEGLTGMLGKALPWIILILLVLSFPVWSPIVIPLIKALF